MLNLPDEHIEQMTPEDLKLHGIPREQDDMIEAERSLKCK